MRRWVLSLLAMCGFGALTPHVGSGVAEAQSPDPEVAPEFLQAWCNSAEFRESAIALLGSEIELSQALYDEFCRTGDPAALAIGQFERAPGLSGY